jgi:rhamnulose-1-phosphate aldolase
VKEPISKNREIQKIISGITEVAQYLWERGWAERNAGNISVNITEFLKGEIEGRFSGLQEHPLQGSGKGLQGNAFIFTGTGTRMRDLARRPEENLCFVKIDDTGKKYQQFCLCDEGMNLQPTSELPTHLAIHEMLLTKNHESKVLVHTHATELIALTQTGVFKSGKELNRILWGMHPETLIFIPEGVGFVPFSIPGTGKIAQATVKELESHPAVIWEKHGVFATGRNVDEAFDTIDLLAKSARIYFTCRNAGYEPGGLTGKQLTGIRKHYNL